MKRGFITVAIFAFFLIPARAEAAFSAATQSANLQVNAKVMPKPEEFQFILSSDHNETLVGAEDEIEYTITYGSYLQYRTPMRIEASWSLGTAQDEGMYSYDIVSYVAGSATKDYWGGSTPVVDLAHRKITWTVTDFPRYTIDKTLRFRLKTPNRYVTDRNVGFTVKATMGTPEITLPDQRLDHVFTPSEFIRKQVAGLHITSLDIRSVTDTSFAIALGTSVPARTTVYYGTDPGDLDATAMDTGLTDWKLLTIGNLKAGTTYYFRILIENDRGIQRKTPEMLTVTTATTSLADNVDRERLAMASRGILLKAFGSIARDGEVIVPVSKPVEVFVPFRKPVSGTVYASLAPSSVLGASTDQDGPDTSIRKVRLLETYSGTFTGTITAPAVAGSYDLVLETDSVDGMNRDVLMRLLATRPVSVRSQGGGPVEGAIVYVERFDPETGKYEYFPADSFGSRNPAYTAYDGTVDMMLPEGQYAVNVDALGFWPVRREFSYGVKAVRMFPEITLAPAPFSPAARLQYYKAAILDGSQAIRHTLEDLSLSYRFLDVNLLAAVFILSCMSVVANLRRIRFSLETVVLRAEKAILSIRGRRTDGFGAGFVEDGDTGFPVHDAIITLTRTGGETLRDATSVLGEFHLNPDPSERYILSIRKTGYTTYRETVEPGDAISRHGPFVMSRQYRPDTAPVLAFVLMAVRALFHGLSDTLLFVAGFLNLYLLFRLGLAAVWFSVCVTAINAALWLDFHWRAFRASRVRQ